jgi:hypothetical protein
MALFSWIVGRKRDFLIEFVDPATATSIKVHCARFLRTTLRNPRAGLGSRLLFGTSPRVGTVIAGAGLAGTKKPPVVALLQPSPNFRPARYFCAPRLLYTTSARGGRVFIGIGAFMWRRAERHQATASYACSIQLKRPRPLWSDARQGAGARMGRDAQGHPTHKAAHQTTRRRLA